MAGDVVYEYLINLNTEQAARSLAEISAHFQRVEQEGNKAFQNIGQSSNVSGVQIGAVAGAVQTLVQQFIQLAAQGVQALVRIGQQSMQLAAQFEASRRMFTNIFEGNEQVATAVMDRVIGKAAELGIEMNDALSLGRAFLPDVQNLEQFDKLLGMMRAMAEIDPAQGIFGARYAIDEAMSGQFRSLRARFEFRADQIERIKQMQQELGPVAGTIEGVTKELERMGVNAEMLGGTFQTSMGKATAAVDKVRVAMGQPMMAEAMAGLEEFSQVMGEKSTGLQEIAGVIGDTLGEIIGFISDTVTGFLAGLDTGAVRDMAVQFYDIVNNVLTFAEYMQLLEVPEGFMEDLDWIMDKLKEGSEWLKEFGKEERIRAARNKAEMEELLKINEEYQGPLAGIVKATNRAAYGEVGGLSPLGVKIAEKLTPDEYARIKAAGDRAEAEALEESDAIEKRAKKRAEERKKRDEERRKKLAELAAAEGEQEAEANRQMEERYARTFGAGMEPDEETAAAIEKVNKATEDIEIQHQRRMAEIDKDALRDRLDAEQDFAEKRLDMARQNNQKVEDIYTAHQERLDDAATDLSRDEEKIARDFARKRVEAEREAAKQQIKIEQDLVDELERIRRRYNEDLLDAERNQDAIAFIEAIRARDREIEEARIGRDQKVEDARLEATEKRDELKTQQQQEVEDARLANAQKLEDLQLRLKRELEDQALNYERDLENQAISEDRKRAQMNDKYLERKADEDQRWREAYEDLSRRMEEEFALIEAWEQKKTEMMVAEEEARQARLVEVRAKYNQFGDSIYGSQMAEAQDEANKAREHVDSIYGGQVREAEAQRQNVDSIYGAQMRDPASYSGGGQGKTAAQIAASRTSTAAPQPARSSSSSFFSNLANIFNNARGTYGQRRQGGGPVWGGEWLVGEAGPELLRIPSGVEGWVVPNNQLMYSPRFNTPGGNTVNSNQRTVIMNVDPGVLSDAQIMRTRQLINQALYDFEDET